MGGHKGILCVYLLSLPVRGDWIEIDKFGFNMWRTTSLPVRGAWIEIVLDSSGKATIVVAPCEGSVD